jgi:hypothetical protein
MVTPIRMPEPLRLRTRGPSRLPGWLVALLAIALVLGLAWIADGGARPAHAGERTAGERDAFIARLEAQVQALHREAARLAERAQERANELSASTREELAAQRERVAELQAEALLRDARERSDENWQEARPHLRQSWEQLREGLRKLLKP